MDKQNVVYPYNWKKEQITDTLNNKKESQKH